MCVCGNARLKLGGCCVCRISRACVATRRWLWLGERTYNELVLVVVGTSSNSDVVVVGLVGVLSSGGGGRLDPSCRVTFRGRGAVALGLGWLQEEAHALSDNYMHTSPPRITRDRADLFPLFAICNTSSVKKVVLHKRKSSVLIRAG